jgi:hypothetical protein
MAQIAEGGGAVGAPKLTVTTVTTLPTARHSLFVVEFPLYLGQLISQVDTKRHCLTTLTPYCAHLFDYHRTVHGDRSQRVSSQDRAQCLLYLFQNCHLQVQGAYLKYLFLV